MEDFVFYFKLGWQHIISVDAFDHLFFIMALTSIYLLKDIKQVLLLITAFTIGHATSLSLSVLNVVKINSALVEFLIPISIIITAEIQFVKSIHPKAPFRFKYVFALLFGLLHGLGFANTIRFILAESQQITLPLLSFNIGLEVGQILIVLLILLLAKLCIEVIGMPQKWWIRILNTIALAAGIYWCIIRFPI
jgi:hypothetical protein